MSSRVVATSFAAVYLLAACCLLFCFDKAHGFHTSSTPLSTAFTLKAPASSIRNINTLLRASSKKDLPVVAPKSSSSSGLVAPWFPSFATAALGGGLFGLDIGSSSSVLRILGQKGFDAGSGVLEILDPIQLGQVIEGFGA